MTAILLALMASAAWGVSDFVGGTASRSRPVLGVITLTRSVGLSAMLVLVLALGEPWVGSRWPFAVLAGFAVLGAMYCLYRALAIGPMAVVAPIFATGAIPPVVWGIVDGETPGVAVLGGLLLAIIGTVLAARAPDSAGRATDPRGVLFALAGAVGMGLGLALLKQASVDSALSAVLLERCTEAVVIILILGRRPRALLAAVRRPGLLPLMGLVDVTALTCFSLATRSGLLPVVAVLASLYPVVTVMLARALQDERMSRVQGAGAAVTLIGVAIVALTA